MKVNRRYPLLPSALAFMFLLPTVSEALETDVIFLDLGSLWTGVEPVADNNTGGPEGPPAIQLGRT